MLGEDIHVFLRLCQAAGRALTRRHGGLNAPGSLAFRPPPTCTLPCHAHPRALVGRISILSACAVTRDTLLQAIWGGSRT